MKANLQAIGNLWQNYNLCGTVMTEPNFMKASVEVWRLAQAEVGTTCKPENPYDSVTQSAEWGAFNEGVNALLKATQALASSSTEQQS